jgi:hypothetical protein
MVPVEQVDLPRDAVGRRNERVQLELRQHRVNLVLAAPPLVVCDRLLVGGDRCWILEVDGLRRLEDLLGEEGYLFLA